MRSILRVCGIVCGLLSLGAGPLVQPAGPAGFVENQGQMDAAVRFIGSSEGGVVYFTDLGPVLQLQQPVAAPLDDQPPRRERERRFARSLRRFSVRLRPHGASSPVTIEGIEPLSARYRYLLGDDRQATEASLFSAVVYRDLWPGVDLIFRNDGGALIYRIVAAPGVDPGVVRFDYDGADSARETADGILLETPLGVLRDRRPDGLNPWGLISLAPADTDFTPSANGRIESGLRWGTFLGGNDSDSIYSLVLDDLMRPIVTGATSSPDFPSTLGVLEENYLGGSDAFVAQLDADGQTLLWSTFLGSVGDDRGWVVRRDSLGRLVVGGVTNSAAFPTTSGAYDVTPNGNYDGFVAKLEADGSALIWSTLFGGGDREWDLSGLELDASDNVIFSGSTRSDDLPTTTGALDDSLSGVSDGFVARLTADGTTLSASTYLGGDHFDAVEDLVLDAAGLAIVTGWTYSGDFPVTLGAAQTTHAGTAQDAFVSKLSTDAGSLIFSTFLGGSDRDEGFGIAIEEPDGIVITGRTDSPDFPATTGAYDTVFSGSFDAFVASLAADGSSVNWATFLGGIGGASALDVAVDPWNQPVLAGWTCGDFPTSGPTYDDSFNGVCDGFVAKLSSSGATLLYGSYVGGWRDDSIYALALDSANHPVVAGEAFSSDFPAAVDSYDPSHNSPDEWYDGFVLSLLTPVYCTDINGDVLTISRAAQASCPAGTPQGGQLDLIEGDVASLGAVDIGSAEIVACASAAVTFATDSTPPPGQALFQLARNSAGSYTDGGGAGLVGARNPLDGDCP